MPATDPRARRLIAVAAALLCVAGASLSAAALGRAFDEDREVNGDAARAAIGAGRWLLIAGGIALLVLRGALARIARARGLAVVACALAGALAAVGVGATALSFAPLPWERAGMPMRERLALLADAMGEAYGPEPEELAAGMPEGRDLAAAAGHFELGCAFLIRGRYEAAAATFERGLAIARAIPPPAEATAAAELRELANQMLKELSGTYLRLGEEENCVRRRNCDSCIFPLKDGALHHDPEGSTRALATLRELYESDPTDLTSKWLYNVAAMTLGRWPEQVPEHLLASPELFVSDHPMERFVDRASAVGIESERMSGGVVLADFDGDDDIDVVSSSMGLRDSLRYYRNEGDGTFVERTDEAGFEGLFGGLSLSQGDFDNDGDADLSVVRGAWLQRFGRLPMSLLENDGRGVFTDVTEEAGLLSFHPGQVGEWADFDNDGWLDLFVGHETTPKNPHPCHLFRNDRDGTFTDVIEASGVRPFGYVKGAAWGDFDDDGWIDLFVARRAEPSSLYRNVAAPDGGRRFEDVSERAGITGTFNSFASWFFDYDEDGDLDLFSATYGRNNELRGEDQIRLPVLSIGPLMLRTGEDMGNGYSRLFRNDGNGRFTDVAREVGLTRVLLVMGANFGDLDSDGWLDLYLGTGNPSFRALMPNKAFRNDRGRRFQDVTTATGLGHLQKGHGIAFADIDNDGDEDVYADLGGFFPSDVFADALYENPGRPPAWITLRLHGVRTNRSAVGARIKVTVETPDGTRALHRVVGCGSSFGSSSLQQEIGLGDATRILAVEVTWPASRTRQEFADLPIGRIVDLTEGDARPVISEPRPFRLRSGEEDARGRARDGE